MVVKVNMFMEILKRESVARYMFSHVRFSSLLTETASGDNPVDYYHGGAWLFLCVHNLKKKS